MKKILVMTALFVALGASAQDISLPQPVKTGGMPLMEALNKRATNRDFSTADLDNQTISNLLWAAWGINRTDDRRTAPSSQNKQPLSLYVALKSGGYLYDAKANKLIQVTKEDVRKNLGKQDFVAIAPLSIAYVADKTKGGAPQTDAGFISQNIYLYCTSANLATVVRGYFDAKEVKTALKLNDNQEVILTQTVGKKK